MSRVDLHPEDLFDRARRGEATEREGERFQAHLERCRACRFEYMLALECADAGGALVGDDLLISRIRRVTCREVDQCVAFRGESQSPRAAASMRLGLVLTSAAVSLWMMTQGVALAGKAWRFVFPQPTVAEPAIRLASATAFDDPATSWDDDRFATSDELFARATVAQRDGQTSEAVRLYAELQAALPGSPEELVSRVVLGRLLLERRDDAKGALGQFDSYLANPEHDALREEALVGRALALERLYRHAEEKHAWQALLAEYPNSAHAGPARSRLGELH